eukprot:8465061-Alexandrium_andersonii.AAC.1
MYAEGVAPELGDLMERAAQETAPIRTNTLSDRHRALGRQLMVMLTMLCKAKALRILSNIKRGNGLEAWRQLH